MNANNKKIHTSLDESLEAFSPYPAYQQVKLVKRNAWFRCITKKFNHDKH